MDSLWAYSFKEEKCPQFLYVKMLVTNATVSQSKRVGKKFSRLLVGTYSSEYKMNVYQLFDTNKYRRDNIREREREKKVQPSFFFFCQR